MTNKQGLIGDYLMDKKYIVKNCPCIYTGWRTMYECFKYNKPCEECKKDCREHYDRTFYWTNYPAMYNINNH